ncbi:STAS domain-containing protein [Streptomyces sp. NPDC088847]|uniref:STAS domain-containing protein n=1 Tax=Streptomyces sp. NPDC088847 TaxID=3365909 RepID=UPI00381F4C8E
MTDTEHAASPGLSAVTHTRDGVRVIRLEGEIDHHTGSIVNQALRATAGCGSHVVFDMGGVTFMDSSGINLLLAAHHDLAAGGGWLRVAGATDAVLHTVQLVGIDRVIEFHDTLDQALTTPAPRS